MPQELRPGAAGAIEVLLIRSRWLGVQAGRILSRTEAPDGLHESLIEQEMRDVGDKG
jgi:hypothetical protein